MLAMLDLGILDLLFTFFNITMKSNAQQAMDQQMNPNLMSWLDEVFYWCILTCHIQQAHESCWIGSDANHGDYGGWKNFQ
jgi:hypothetical protein